MNRLEHRRRTRVRKRIALGVLGVAAVGGGLAFGVLQDRGPEEPAPSASPSATPSQVPMQTTLLSVTNTADQSRVLAIPPLLISSPLTGGEATALLLDSAMRAVGPAGEAPLRQHASGFGPEGLAGAIRNELGLQVDHVAEITEVELAGILDGVGALDIAVPTPIEEQGTEVYGAGIHRMDAPELVTFLAFPFADPAIDATIRSAILADAWEEIATAPSTRRAVRDAALASDAAAAFEAFAQVVSVEPIPVQQVGDGVVLDELLYEALSPRLEPIWLHGLEPQQRPTVDLRGQTLVEPILLLAADGIRILRVTVEPVRALTIETDDLELGGRIVSLLGGGRIGPPGEPLRTGLDARITFPRAA